MTVSEFIKIRLKEINSSQSELAKKLNITKQNLNNKLNRDNFSSQEISEILKVLNCDFIFKDSDNKEYKINYES